MKYWKCWLIVPPLIVELGCGGSAFTAGPMVDTPDSDPPLEAGGPESSTGRDTGLPDAVSTAPDAGSRPETAPPAPEASMPEASPPPETGPTMCPNTTGTTQCGAVNCDYGTSYCAVGDNDQSLPLPETCEGVCPPTSECVMAGGDQGACQGGGASEPVAVIVPG
jgi:hypothetical protein